MPAATLDRPLSVVGVSGSTHAPSKTTALVSSILDVVARDRADVATHLVEVDRIGPGLACTVRRDALPASVQLELELSHPDNVNQNPELQAESLGFDDEAWPELAPVSGDCKGQGYVEVDPASTHTIQVQLDEQDRDPLPHPDKLDPTRESLQLSHFATDGDLGRAFDPRVVEGRRRPRALHAFGRSDRLRSLRGHRLILDIIHGNEKFRIVDAIIEIVLRGIER